MKWRKVSAVLSDLLAEAVVPFPSVKKIMFGSPAYFVNENMFAGVHQETIMIRLSEADRQELKSAYDEASPFEPMPGRPMREYMAVPATLYDDAKAFAVWLERAHSYAAALPPKAGTAKASRKKNPPWV
ncbi:MAG: TfoX/Sxy family protein [Chloroflexota bacterium]